MKRHLKKYTSLANYIEFLRRQPEHMQHVYAAIFAGSITAVIAFVILYSDYGFWHERYVRDDTLVTNTTLPISGMEKDAESPSEMLGGFFSEARDRLKEIKIPSIDAFKSTETYRNDEAAAIDTAVSN